MRKTLLALLFIPLFLIGCASKKTQPPKPAPVECPLDSPADLKNFPQNLEVYADKFGKNKLLLNRVVQDELNASFTRILLGPWKMSRTSVRRGEISGLLKNARGYKDGSNAWTQGEWEAMRRNANLTQFPSRAAHAITLRNTDLREAPTHTPRYVKPTPDPREEPFDYFQYSLLPIGTPVLIAHTSLDGRWHFVECPVAGGWVDANDLAMVDENFKALWQNSNFAALIRDHVRLPGTGKNGGDSQGGIGATLPLASGPKGGINILVPVKGRNGMADTAEITLAPADAVIRPMPLTPGNVAKVGNVMMGQPYGWGGTLGERDCSALTRELFTPFGIWLPRNSVPQGKRGSVISLQGMGAREKSDVILKNGIPFLSLLGMKGHITLYIGEWQGKPAIFHNVWGLRIVRDGNDNERLVIGRAVVTSITPGLELENLYRPVTFVDRLRTLSNPAAR